MILTDKIKKYYDIHLRCPICGRKVIETVMTPPKPIDGIPYRDFINTVQCGECGWRGKVDELKG